MRKQTITMTVILLLSIVAGSLFHVNPVQAQDGTEPLAILDAGIPVYLPFASTEGILPSCAVGVQNPYGIELAGFPPIGSNFELTDAEMDEMMLDFTSMVDALKQSGAGWVRVYINWSSIQPTSTTFNWGTLDYWISEITKAGIKVIGVVSNPPLWAATGKDDVPICTNMVTNFTGFSKFLETLVRRYGGMPYYVKTWEIMNEPDAEDSDSGCDNALSNYADHPEVYRQVLTTASNTIRSIDPTAKILFGGLAYDWFNEYKVEEMNGPFDRYMVDHVVSDTAVRSTFDAFNFHYFPDWTDQWSRWTTTSIGDYQRPSCNMVKGVESAEAPLYSPWGIDIMAKTSHLLTRMEGCYGIYGKEYWVTEIGQHGITKEQADAAGPVDCTPLSQNYYNNLYCRYYKQVNTADPRTFSRQNQTLDTQARYVWQSYARVIAGYGTAAGWYALKIIPLNTPPDYQGLLYDSRNGDALNGKPKPAFYAYQALAKELPYPKVLEHLIVPSGTPTEVAGKYFNQGEAYKFSSCKGTVIMGWTNLVGQKVTLPLTGAKSADPLYRPYASSEWVRQVQGTTGNLSIELTNEPVIIRVTY